MKTPITSQQKHFKALLACVLALFVVQTMTASFLPQQEPNGKPYIEYKGKVFDAVSEDPIAEAHLAVKNAEISTITNAEGIFLLKIPKDLSDAIISITKVGYQRMNMQLVYFDKKFTKISLSPSPEKLEQISLYTAKDARKVVQKAMDKKGENYGTTLTPLTAFYREKIDRGNRNVMLAEAVVKINKSKYTSGRKGEIYLYKSRKHTDYKHLDTLAVKLRGGPYTPLYLDIMKYPQFLFYENSLEGYTFKFDDPTKIAEHYIYVVNFEQKDKHLPWYHGKMYIDAESNALVKATYSLNVDNRKEAMRMLIIQKPWRAKVYPLETRYQVDYLQKKGKWYYSYGQAFLKLKVNWKHKLFNARYAINSEMVITNRSKTKPIPKDELTKIKPTVIMADDVSGFKDPDFWGSNNIIEPDESIQDAIEEIQEKMEEK